MDAAGFSPNAETYATLLHACVEARNEEKVGAVLSDMTSKVPPLTPSLQMLRAV